METMGLAFDEQIMIYNVSSITNLSLLSNGTNEDSDRLDWGSFFYTTNIPLNATFQEVTILTSLGRAPARPRIPSSFLTVLLKNLDALVMPIALSVGILGSVILVLTFMCTPLRASALSHYLTALGVSDFIYLLSCLAVWVAGRGIKLYDTIGVCQITTFALLLSRFLTTWYLFAAHAERFLVHFGSCRAKKWCTTFRTKCIIIAIFVFSLVGFLHYIWTHVVDEKRGKVMCRLMEDSLKHIVALRKIEIITALFLPMLLIVVIDIALLVSATVNYVKKLFSKASKGPVEKDTEWRGEYTLANRDRSRSPSTRSGDSTPPPPEFDLSREKFRATILVVVAGLLFISLVLPSSIYRAKINFSKLSRPSNKDMLTMLLCEEIVKFNSVYKVFLYVIVLKSFRNGLVHFFKSRFRRKENAEPLQETSV